MKRSEIDRYIDEAAEFFAKHHLVLPPFASWTPQQWRQMHHRTAEIRRCRLGWDITDFGAGDFHKFGLTLFTLRNGFPAPDGTPAAGSVPYAEKAMLVRPGQLTPMHFHWHKTEDIINRGAGVLVVQLHNSDAAENVAGGDVRVRCDGIERVVEAGGNVELSPGESITLMPRVYHAFWARADAGWALVGEVSSVNDDATDNRFDRPLPRFPSVEEDAPRRHLLCGEYEM
jgi:D-lyxose ketol-isomerase